MAALEITLLVTGIILLVGSFFITEKLTDNDVESIQKLTNEEIERIIRDKMADARIDMEDSLKDAVNDAMEDLERKTDKETNEKILQISEYSDTVLDSVNKSHNEVMFMYSMLNDKQQTVTDMTKELQELKSEITAIDKGISNKLEKLKDSAVESLPQKRGDLVINIPTEEEVYARAAEPDNPMSVALASQFATDESKGNGNLEILELHDQGLSEVEIAKKLGRGLGEVKFVLGLYQEGR